jgi:NAD(P)-dependent dehydrogenase (short-subunit alcohol dehydrogenase family)
MTADAPAPRTDPLDFTGRLIVISGAAGAIGAVVVDAFLARGATVIALDVVPDDAPIPRDWASRANVRYVQVDVTDEDAVTASFSNIERDYQRTPDVVCAHAGVVDSFPVQSYPVEAFDRLMSINVRGAWLLATEASRRWIAAGSPGLLLFTTSWVQDVPWPGISAYSASKAALKSLTRSFARELAPQGIRANAIAPGIVGVGMAKRQWDTEPDYRARAARAIPLGDMQSPDSVADAFVFLASPMASYMTGSTLVVDGGCSLYPMD